MEECAMGRTRVVLVLDRESSEVQEIFWNTLASHSLQGAAALL
jgi:hypothetical protein